MKWTMVKEMNEIDYVLKEINKKSNRLKGLRKNVIIKVDNITREELRLS